MARKRKVSTKKNASVPAKRIKSKETKNASIPNKSAEFNEGIEGSKLSSIELKAAPAKCSYVEDFTTEIDIKQEKLDYNDEETFGNNKSPISNYLVSSCSKNCDFSTEYSSDNKNVIGSREENYHSKSNSAALEMETERFSIGVKAAPAKCFYMEDLTTEMDIKQEKLDYNDEEFIENDKLPTSDYLVSSCSKNCDFSTEYSSDNSSVLGSREENYLSKSSSAALKMEMKRSSIEVMTAPAKCSYIEDTTTDIDIKEENLAYNDEKTIEDEKSPKIDYLVLPCSKNCDFSTKYSSDNKNVIGSREENYHSKSNSAALKMEAESDEEMIRNEVEFSSDSDEEIVRNEGEFSSDSDDYIVDNEESTGYMDSDSDAENLYSETEESCSQSKRITGTSNQNLDLSSNEENQLCTPTISNELIFKFNATILAGPTCCCTCCGCLFFKKSVKQLRSVADILDKSAVNVSEYNYIKTTTYICRRCLEYLQKNKLSPIALANGLNYPKVPNCISELSALEEKMVSPIIPFMQIQDLHPHSINSQCGTKGSIVHIPMDSNEVFEKVLPRSSDKLFLVHLESRRNTTLPSNYCGKTIRPFKIIEALQFLTTMPLYIKHNIKINNDFYLKYKDHSNLEIKINNKSNEYNQVCVKQSDSVSKTSETKNEGCSNKTLETNAADKTSASTGDFLIMSNNDSIASRAKISITLGENKKPLSINSRGLEELSHPKIYAGQRYSLKRYISYHERAKSELLREDRRSCTPPKILFMAKKITELLLHSKVSIAVRKSSTTNLTASQAISEDNLNFLCDKSAIHSVLEDIADVRVTPAYFSKIKRQLLAMIRQLGPPTLFLTLSAAEKRWPELLRILHYNLYKKMISVQQAEELSDAEKSFLVQNDPVTCARYFNFRTKTIFNQILLNKEGPFHEHFVKDYYYSVEFQNCGSPQIHCFLWLANAPNFLNSDVEDQDGLLNFVDRFISAKKNEYSDVQFHSHTEACYETSKKVKKENCRFPQPIFDKTIILQPNSSKIKKDIENYSKVKDALINLEKERSSRKNAIELEEFLNTKLEGMSMDSYVAAITSAIKRTTIFLKRNSDEIFINNYNIDLLMLMNSHMDLQFITDPHTCAQYIVNYLSKPNNEVAKMLNCLANKSLANNNIKNMFYKVAHVFLNFTTVGTQEAVYLILGLETSKFSRQCIYINTNQLEKRYRLLKSKNKLKKLNPDSKDIYLPDNIDKYAARSEQYENYCLADFMTEVEDEEKKVQNNEIVTNFTCEKRKIICVSSYTCKTNELNYYREQLMLFFPWRSEEKELNISQCKLKYETPAIFKIINKNRKKYSIGVENKDVENLLFDLNELDDNSDDAYVSDNFDHTIDDQHDTNSSSGSSFPIVKRILPILEFEESDSEIVSKLNTEQKSFVLQILDNYKKGETPFYYFLSGSAGCGKSLTVKSIHKIITNHYKSQTNEPQNVDRVLTMAFTEKAASLVRGITIYKALALSSKKFSGNLGELSTDVANNLRANFKFIKLIIIDEISMVGRKLLSQINTRLIQIFGNKASFGGISVLFVGDLKQIPPIADKRLFKTDRINIADLGITTLWESFKFFELKQIMRQTNNVNFIKALDNFGEGKATNIDMCLLNSRVISNKEIQLPGETIHLCYDNKSVDALNSSILKNLGGISYYSNAEDTINSQITETKKLQVLEMYKNKPTAETKGFHYHLQLKIGAVYMLIQNIDVNDGLVNGTVGILKNLLLDNGQVRTLFFYFEDKSIGVQARRKYSYKKLDASYVKLTPVEKMDVSLRNEFISCYNLTRKQFPITPALALTIHKSHGSTFKKVCVHMDNLQTASNNLLYVALSRTEKFKDLFLTHEITPIIYKPNESLIQELHRLRNDAVLKLPLLESYQKDRFTIYYHNVQALNFQKCHLITTDALFANHDIIILSEAYVSDFDRYKFPSFKCIPVSSKKQKADTINVICYSKEDIHVIKFMTRKDKYGVVHIFLLRCKSVFIISGYSSQNIMKKTFKSLIKALVSQVPPNSRLVVMGDFNFDNLAEKNHDFWENLIPNTRLKCALPKDAVTTKYNSQSDVIYTNLDQFNAQVYLSFFSDHYPVYFQIP